MNDKSTEQLGTDFADGWRKLPDELRIEVLKHNLVFDKPISYRIHKESVGKRSDLSHGAILRHHIALGPEIAALALQVFYENNTVEVTHNSRTIRVPPPHVRHYTTYLKWSELGPLPSWLIISKLATNAFGFNRVRHLTLALGVQSSVCLFFIWRSYTKYHMPATPIVFKCKGVVEVILNGPEDSEETHPWFVPRKEIEKDFQEKIVFAG